MKYFQQSKEKYKALGKQGRSANGGANLLGKCHLEGAGWTGIPSQAAPNEVFWCNEQAWGGIAAQAQSDFAPNYMIIKTNEQLHQAGFAVRYGAFVNDTIQATSGISLPVRVAFLLSESLPRA